jgi:nitrous oxidase accessory protein
LGIQKRKDIARMNTALTALVALWSLAFSTPILRAATNHASLQERIQSAAPGEIIVVQPGVYQGNLIIDRPVSLRGLDQPLIQGDRTGHVIQITAPGVVIEGFRIQGSGVNLSADHAGIHITADQAVVRDNRITRSLHGIYVRAASQVRIEKNVIRGMDPADPALEGDDLSAFGAGELCASSLAQDRRGNGIHFWNSNENSISGNEISATRDGIYFSFTNQTRVENNTIFNARYGLHYMYSHQNLFANNRFFENAAGAALMYSKEIVLRHNQFLRHRGQRAYGILFQSVDRTILQNNLVQGNSTGIFLQNSYGNSARLNRFIQNYVGIRINSSSMDNLFTGNSIENNIHNLDLAGRSLGNQWHENGAGNFWKNAATLDLDHDGVSEMAHTEVDLLGPLRQEFPYVAFLSGSPGLKALQFGLSRAPLPRTPRITDPHPLIASPQIKPDSKHDPR